MHTFGLRLQPLVPPSLPFSLRAGSAQRLKSDSYPVASLIRDLIALRWIKVRREEFAVPLGGWGEGKRCPEINPVNKKVATGHGSGICMSGDGTRFPFCRSSRTWLTPILAKLYARRFGTTRHLQTTSTTVTIIRTRVNREHLICLL